MGKTPRKRRAARSQTKVSRRQKKTPRFVYPEQPELQAVWDENKTLKQNYVAVGLALDANASTNPKKNVLPEEKELLGVPPAAGSDQKEKRPPPPQLVVPEAAPSREPTVTKAKVDYFLPLIKKYGSDYNAMFKDIKLNYMQHTKTVLKKQCEWLLRELETEAQQQQAAPSDQE